MFTPAELPEPHDTQHSPDAGAVESQAAGSHPREPRTSGQRNTAVVFWQALNPVERDAFRLFALPRTFAAGATLIQEGDQADHVIVILSGRTKICVEESAGERILAVRGPGQLVGERAALQISIRSASVIAIETVQAQWHGQETSQPSSPTIQECSPS